jgi:hypothetical protein
LHLRDLAVGDARIDLAGVLVPLLAGAEGEILIGLVDVVAIARDAAVVARQRLLDCLGSHLFQFKTLVLWEYFRQEHTANMC